jgi:TonB family protein
VKSRFLAITIFALLPLFGATAQPSPTETPKIIPTIEGHKLRSADEPKPRWPKEAITNRWTGQGVIALYVHADGIVYDAQVSKSSGHELLDREAIRAFRQWRFQPEKADFTVKVPFKFEFLERPFTKTSHLTKRWS